MLLVQPVSAEELANAGVVGFLLWGFEGHKLVEVLVDEGGFARASTCGVWRAVSVLDQIS